MILTLVHFFRENSLPSSISENFSSHPQFRGRIILIPVGALRGRHRRIRLKRRTRPLFIISRDNRIIIIQLELL